MTVQTENEYEDLLGLWSDLESGLGIILGSPASIQEFEQRVWQYDRWMQTLLQRAGYSAEAPDGRLGQATREAVRKAQIKLGLPADSYPSAELITALEAGR